jgi:CheY-like chemotaxis protein
MSTILVVDDDETFRRLLCQTLLRAGHEVLAADDGRGALRLYRQQPADLVITDLIMPEQEGLETILELRRLQPDLKIIAISGGGRMVPGDYLPIARHLGAARTLASRMLGLAEAELQGDDMVNDAIGELSNMIVGCAKSRLCDAGAPCVLTIPSIVRGQSFVIEPACPCNRHLLGFRCGADHIMIELLMERSR